MALTNRVRLTGDPREHSRVLASIADGTLTPTFSGNDGWES